MPIIERTAHGCFEVFAEHMRGLIAATVTDRHPLAMVFNEPRMILSFREDKPVAVPVETSYGRLHFYLGQSLEALHLAAHPGPDSMKIVIQPGMEWEKA